MLDVAQVGFTEAYVAYKCRDGRVIAIACHIRYYNAPYFNFGYKDVSEDMGPYICNCPERILKQLSPTDNNWAKEWRKRCWESIRRKKKSSLIRDGDFIKFREPISFQGGETLNLFKVEKADGGFFSKEHTIPFHSTIYWSTIFVITELQNGK